MSERLAWWVLTGFMVLCVATLGAMDFGAGMVTCSIGLRLLGAKLPDGENRP